MHWIAKPTVAFNKETPKWVFTMRYLHVQHSYSKPREPGCIKIGNPNVIHKTSMHWNENSETLKWETQMHLINKALPLTQQFELIKAYIEHVTSAIMQAGQREPAAEQSRQKWLDCPAASVWTVWHTPKNSASSRGFSHGRVANIFVSTARPYARYIYIYIYMSVCLYVCMYAYLLIELMDTNCNNFLQWKEWAASLSDSTLT